MHLVRTGVVVALMTLAPALLSAQQSAAPQNVERMRWYDAYNLGIKAVQAKQWQNAEAYLQQAKSAVGSPPQGRRVYYYGDTYLPFYPDYYLGIVYLNTRRQALAETAFADVQRRNLIDPKERQFNELQQLARQATFERSMDEARGFIEKGDLTEAGKRATEARATNFDNGKADSIQQDIILLAKKVDPAPKPVVTDPPPVQKPDTPIQPPVAVDAQNNPPVLPPPMAVTPPTQKPIYPTPTPPANAAQGAIAGPGGLLASAYVQFARAGLLAYFSGDYGEAIQQLEVIPENVADARLRVFLACARTAAVLTGRGDATVLRTARAGYRSAGGANALRAQDRRFISPKIIELLEKS